MLRYAAAGVLLGILLLHPVMEAVYWFGSHDRLAAGSASLGHSIGARLLRAFGPDMLAMTGLFAVLGGGIGTGFGLLASRMNRTGEVGLRPEGEDQNVAALIAAGEGERIEFKASLRWDPHLGRSNRALEDASARAIAGFLNHAGGTLLIGVGDSGDITGLAPDYGTLRRPDRDGLQQFLMGLVQSRLGGHVCAQVHVGFGEVRGLDVCRVTVEPSAAPVYYQDGAVARYFVRTGNGTRELDVREAIVHLARRRMEAGPPGPDSG